jgi:hypothetical protein
VDTGSVLGLPTLRPAFLDDVSSPESRATNTSCVQSSIVKRPREDTTRDNDTPNAKIGSLLIGGRFMLHYYLEDDLDHDPEDDEDEDFDENDDDLDSDDSDEEGGDDDDEPETWQVAGR